MQPPPVTSSGAEREDIVNADELKPCPFCGEPPKVLQRPDSLDKFYCAISCFCGGYTSNAHQFGTGETPDIAYEEAKQKWNCRKGEKDEIL
jgi:hypothetical protein